VGRQNFTIWRVFRISFGVIKRNLVLFLMVALILEFPVNYLGIAFGGDEVASIADVADIFVRAALDSLLASAISYAVGCDARGNRADLAGMLTRMRAVFFPVLVLSLLFEAVPALPWFLAPRESFGGTFALVWFLGSWLVLTVLLWTAVPVAVAEGRGVVPAVRRALSQSKGQHVRILGMLLILVSALLIGLILEWLVGEGALFMFEQPGLAEWLLAAVFDLMLLVAMAVSYFLLDDPDPDPESVAAVFE